MDKEIISKSVIELILNTLREREFIREKDKQEK